MKNLGEAITLAIGAASVLFVIFLACDLIERAQNFIP